MRKQLTDCRKFGTRKNIGRYLKKTLPPSCPMAWIGCLGTTCSSAVAVLKSIPDTFYTGHASNFSLSCGCQSKIFEKYFAFIRQIFSVVTNFRQSKNNAPKKEFQHFFMFPSLACGSFEENIRLYTPDSLIVVVFWFPPGVGKTQTPLSSSSTWSLTASAVRTYPRFSATSFPTNQAVPFSSVRVLTEKPKSVLVKVTFQRMGYNMIILFTYHPYN